MKEFKVTEEYSGLRLDRYIQKTCRDIPKGAVMRLIRKGDVKLNNKKASPETRITDGDIIKVYAVSEDFTLREMPFFGDIEVLYEDDYLLFVDKPAFLPTHSADASADSLTNRVRFYLKEEIIKSAGRFIPGTPSRLDTNTSGIIVFGKNSPSSAKLSELSREGRIEKHYTCLCRGVIKKSFLAENYAVKNTQQNIMLPAEADDPESVKMQSVITPICTYSFDETTKCFTRLSHHEDAKAANGTILLSLTNVRLITGRTHQIRFQLSQNSTPIVGDIKYGDEQLNLIFKNSFNLNRQYLYASSLSLPLWYDGSTLKVTAPTPRELDFLK